MEPKFQSSFIPKGPIGTTASLSRASVEAKGGLVGFIATIIFVLALVTSIGVFAYDRYLLSSISKMGTDLEAARATLDPESIKELTQLNSRIVTTESLLNQHTVLSPLFDYLESSTVKTVRFTQFTFLTSEKGLTLSMRGQARGYTAVALQSDIFNKSKYLKNSVFGDLALDNSGNVIFSFTTTLDPSIISYKKQLDSSNASSNNQKTTTSTTTPTAGMQNTNLVSTSTSSISSTTATSSPRR